MDIKIGKKMEEAFFAFLGVLVVNVAGIVKSIIDRRNSKKQISDIDKKQDERINSILDKIDVLEKNVNILNKYNEKSRFKFDLKSALKYTVSSICENNSITNKKLKGFFDDGKKVVYEVFSDIISDGLKQTKLNDVKDDLLNGLKSVRNNAKENGIPNQFLHDIKYAVIYPEIENTIIELSDIINGKFNGTTNEEFIQLAVNTVASIVKKSIQNWRLNGYENKTSPDRYKPNN